MELFVQPLATVGLPWYGWLLIVLCVIAWGMLRLGRAFRGLVRAELIALLREKHPDWKVVAETPKHLDVERPNPKDPAQPLSGRIMLRRVYAAAATSTDQTADGRRPLIEPFADLSLMDDMEDVRLETHGDKIFPRIVNDAMLKDLSHMHVTPSEPLGDTGLHIVCVIDGAKHVAYLTQSMLDELATDFTTIKQLALGNLAKRFDYSQVRAAVMKKEVMLIESGDSYDAARLLLVPQHMIPGETLAAMIPDRDTLVLSPLPPNGNWKPFEQLARSPRTDRVICNRPLKVTAQGVFAV